MKPSTRMMLLAGRKSDGRENDRDRDRDYRSGDRRYRDDMEYTRGRDNGSRGRNGDYNGRDAQNGYSAPPDGGYGYAHYDHDRPEPEWASRSGRERRRYDDGRYAPQNRVMPFEPYPMYPPPMQNRYDDDDLYRGTNMGFMHHDMGGYEFQMDGRAGNMKGYAKGRVIPMDSEHKKMGSRNHEEEYEPLDERTAKMWINNMENVDGTKGGHYSMEKTEQLMKQHKIDCDLIDFYVALNMVWSDDREVAKKFGVDKDEYYVCLAEAWLDDPDIPGGGAEKLAKYYEYVVK